MADVGHLPGVWEQIRLVAGLRWRILGNNLRKKHNQWDLIGMIFAGVFAGLFVIGLCVAFCFGAYAFMSRGREGWIALLFWGIFLFWQLFPIFTAGFGAGFEFRTLLRFPLSLRAFYVIGLAYGVADFAALASICWLTAMIIGATVANSAVLPAMLLISALFLLMNITLERMIGSWLERILARRRAREMFFALFILFAISVQFINPLVQRYGRTAQPWVRQVVPYLSVFPPSLAGRAISGAAQNHFSDVLVGAAGISAYVLLFSVFLWLRFATQYRGRRTERISGPCSRRRSSCFSHRRTDRRAPLAHAASCCRPSQRVPLPYAQQLRLFSADHASCFCSALHHAVCGQASYSHEASDFD